MSLQHLIVTRYNLFLYTEARPKGMRPLGFLSPTMVRSYRRAGFETPDDWMAHRLDLFERFCVPSIVRQTDKTFEWIVLMDGRTPCSQVDAVRALVETVGEVVMIDREAAAPMRGYQFVPSIINARVDPQTEYLITTGVDNDDAVHEDFVAAVHERIDPRRNAEFIDPVCGYFARPNGERIHLAQRFFANGCTSFVSLGERVLPGKAPLTRFCAPHSKVAGFAPVVRINTSLDEPLWMRTIHGRNVSGQRMWGEPVAKVRPGFHVRFC